MIVSKRAPARVPHPYEARVGLLIFLRATGMLTGEVPLYIADVVRDVKPLKPPNSS